ncbi:serine/threonine-protein kinase M1, partial [Kappamyces sp. JEL0680]
YHFVDQAIALYCCDCLGIIGAVDPSRMEIAMDIKQEFGPEYAMNSPEDVLLFSCALIEKHLVSAFKSTQDSKLQASISFTIQELLRWCGFTPEIVQEASQLQQVRPKVKSKDGIRKSLIERWKSFPVSILSTLLPLVASRYHIENVVQPRVGYPIFHPNLTYVDWLRCWCLDLIPRSANSNALKAFGTFSSVIAYGDIATAQLLLPHLVTNVLNGDPAHAEDLSKEFCYLLTVNTSNKQHRLCIQMIFRLIDHISKRVAFCRSRGGKAKGRSSTNSATVSAFELEAHNLDSFLKRIPQSMIAKSAIQTKSYARALMHYELYFRYERLSKSNHELQPLYCDLQDIYAQLEDVDSLQGLASKLEYQSLDQQIAVHEVNGEWMSAHSCYEVLLQSSPTNSKYQHGLLNALQNMGHYESMVLHAQGIQNKLDLAHADTKINSRIIAATWRIGDWERLAALLQDNKFEPSFDTMVGELLLALHSSQPQVVQTVLHTAKARLMHTLAAAAMESYNRSYDCLVKLTQLHEIEWFYQNILHKKCPGTFELVMTQVSSLSDCRIEIMEQKKRNELLTLRRLLAKISLSIYPENEAYINSSLGSLWIKSAKVARKMLHFQTANSAILQAIHYRAPESSIQHAKLLWEQNQRYQAMSFLQLIVNRGLSQPEQPDTRKERLLLASWKDISGGIISSALISAMTSLTKEYPQWEKAQFLLGRYYNRVYEFEKKHQDALLENPMGRTTTSAAHIIVLICKQYARSLTLGSKYLYEAMPRMLSLWLDLGDRVCEPDFCIPKDAPQISERLDHLNNVIRRCITRLPPFQFLTALPQLISRISHPHPKVQDTLEGILVTILVSYPQQSLWHLMAVAKSTYKNRVARVTSVFTKAKALQKSSTMSQWLQYAEALTEGFLNLCNFPIPKEITKLSMSKDFKGLDRLVQSMTFRMIVPLQSSLTARIPSRSSGSELTRAEAHEAFPSDLPTIVGFKDQIDVMSSLQRPRRITVLGSDGKEYIFLCKPDDDLRKDSRLMELNSIVNKLFKKDSEARHRKLLIRTYAVIPLNEKCGLIQWIGHMNGFRHILVKAYKERNLYTPHTEIKELLGQVSPGQDPSEVFVRQILPRHPPIFYTWFLETFPEPAKWLASRCAYTSTVAVMSMVGYIVGLGDRHGENILFDELTGEALHVDLNCLFEKGKSFEIPERVPFRLTHNMVDAFGVLGIDGGFVKCCQVALGILRDHQDLLLGILETFLHDPLCEWASRRGQQLPEKMKRSGHNINALKTLGDIKRKLQGFVDSSKLPVNVPGQVDFLVQEATSASNLSRMYIGWAAYL